MIEAKKADGGERSPWLAALFLLLGVVNLTDYFYKSQFELSDLLQGIGFLAAVPWTYFNPPKRPGAGGQVPRAWPATKWLAAAGLALALIGSVMELA